jgi:transcriptional regulator with XRE-family HTH domain
MRHNAKRTGQRIRKLREDRGWTHDRMVREVLAHPDLGPEHAISESSVYRAERGGLMSVRTRYPIAVVLGLKPSDLWSDDVLSNSRPRRSPDPQEVAA